MPKPKGQRTRTSKALYLAWMLLFSGRWRSLAQLAEDEGLACSKQTVASMLDDIEFAFQHEMERKTQDKQSWVRLRAPGAKPTVVLDETDLQYLKMAVDLAGHVLPEGLRRDVERAIQKATILLPTMERNALALVNMAAGRSKGSIDYGDKLMVLEILLTGILERRLVRIAYAKPGQTEPVVLVVAPLRLVGYHDALYLRCTLYDREGAAPLVDGDRSLGVHRMVDIDLFDTRFKFEPAEDPPRSFGFMQGDSFRVSVEFTPAVAAYVTERTWSDDQSVRDLPGGGVELEFSATSRPEVVSWVLSFGPEARVVAPAELGAEVVHMLDRARERYRD